MAYVTAEASDGEDAGCPFCAIPQRSDEDGLVLRRGEHAYVVLNLHPYNPGHLMVLPLRHVADYEDLTPRRAPRSPCSPSRPCGRCGRSRTRTRSTSA
jgi:hypothetical protein